MVVKFVCVQECYNGRGESSALKQWDMCNAENMHAVKKHIASLISVKPLVCSLQFFIYKAVFNLRLVCVLVTESTIGKTGH